MKPENQALDATRTVAGKKYKVHSARERAIPEGGVLESEKELALRPLPQASAGRFTPRSRAPGRQLAAGGHREPCSDVTL